MSRRIALIGLVASVALAVILRPLPWWPGEDPFLVRSMDFFGFRSSFRSYARDHALFPDAIEAVGEDAIRRAADWASASADGQDQLFRLFFGASPFWTLRRAWFISKAMSERSLPPSCALARDRGLVHSADDRARVTVHPGSDAVRSASCPRSDTPPNRAAHVGATRPPPTDASIGPLREWRTR